MNDSVIVSAACADIAPVGSLPPGGQTADAIFGSFRVNLLDRSAFETDAKAERGRHTAVSYRLCKMVPRLLRGAGLTRRQIAGPGTGLISGSLYGCSQVFEMHRRLRRHGPRGIDAVRFAQATHSYPVSICAIEFGLKGPCLAVVSTETAGMDAFLCAHDWITDGRCDRVIVVGYEDMATPIRDHIRTARAHSAADGSVSEAMVMLLLERSASAAMRGAPSDCPRIAGMTTLRTGDAVSEAETGLPDTLGANGLVEIARLVNASRADRQGRIDWQIAARAQSGRGVAADLRIPHMEFAL